MRGNIYLTDNEKRRRKLELLARERAANLVIISLFMFLLGFALIVASANSNWDSDLFTTGLFMMIFSALCFFGRHVKIDVDEYADYLDSYDEDDEAAYEWYEDNDR